MSQGIPGMPYFKSRINPSGQVSRSWFQSCPLLSATPNHQLTIPSTPWICQRSQPAWYSLPLWSQGHSRCQYARKRKEILEILWQISLPTPHWSNHVAVVAVIFIQKWTFRTDVEQIGVIRLWRSLRGRPIITISVDAVEVAAPSVASSRQEYGVAVRTGVITSFQTVQYLPLAGAIFNQFVYLLWRWHLPFVSPFFMGNVITHACYVGIAFENLSCYLYGFIFYIVI